jgi:hypothetical protein
MSPGRRRLALALLLPALALGAAACGDDDDEETTPSVTAPAAIETAPTTTAAPTTTTPAEATTTKPPKTGGTPSYDPAKPDTPENDVPPPPGSPQEAFERQCQQNPAACG